MPLTPVGRTLNVGVLEFWHVLSQCHRTVELREGAMKWTMPRIVEIAVGLEINSYACAELK
jgi:coenzyme PQQ precursor peptide PqqA